MPNGIHIPRVVITGGPCSGKTTGMSYIVEKLQDYGYKAFVVPEMATLLQQAGFDISVATELEFMSFEEQILRLQIPTEETITQMARDYLKVNPDAKAVVLCDRGAMDGMAYLPTGRFKAILDDLGMNLTQVRDGRYEGVTHLVTAAIGAQKFYTYENNPARWEDLEEAAETDIRTRNAWVGVPHLSVIDNSTDFEGKMRRALQSICRILGIPVPVEFERKFLLSHVEWRDLPHHQTVDIEQVYLLGETDQEEIRVRKRGQFDSYCYFKTRKVATSTLGKRLETERSISGRDYYEERFAHSDPTRQPIVKDRTCFLWGNQHDELDVIRHPERHENLILLEVELTEENSHVEIPPFVEVVREVTGEGKYSNASLALI